MPHFGRLHYAGRTTLSDKNYNTPKVDGKVSWKHILGKEAESICLATAWSAGPALPALHEAV